MKFSIDDLLKNPILVMIVIVVGSCMTIFVSQNFASVEYLEKRISEVKETVNNENQKINNQLGEIKGTMKDVDKNIIEIYKMIKYQEGRNAK